MVKRMLIDATHPEETRVVVVNGTKLEEFDFETSTKKQLKGNIYLAKVIRIEPSLQAAFVDYGGNRHGFLAFSEIHPDYYQIPVADREALIAEQERRARQSEEQQENGGGRRWRNRRNDRNRRPAPAAEGHEAPLAAGDENTETAIAQSDAQDQLTDLNGGEIDSMSQKPISEASEPSVEPINASDNEWSEGRIEPAGDYREEEQRHEAHDDSPAPDDQHSDDANERRAEARIDWPVARDEGSRHDDEDRSNDVRSDRDDIDAAPTDENDSHRIAPEGDYRDAEPLSAASRDEGGLADETPSDLPGGAADEAPSNGYDAALSEAVTPVETLGGEDLGEEERPRRSAPLRNYKIQEVIKRRQILLVQVVKEERGNKGAALTTYLSLAGRYAVLMPNAGRGGGISRKISNPADRKRMKEMLSELEVPGGMGVILRTAGLERSKAEIKRDYDYLVRLWDTIREVTLKSTAPALIYEEGNLIKRSIRDLYNKDIEDIAIEGEEGYRAAKDFMRQLMPSHAKKVQLYNDQTPLFHRYQVETQLDAMHSPVVQLRSGGYIVINPTEALVAIDVNSGRATKERNIEETALRTNAEAAEEIARQLRLRDLAGLIVIDFIDMEDQRHQQQVERRLKEAMRSDRARIQIGRISAFGLLELSRQRLRPSLLEISTEICPHCEGTGRVRSTESTVLHVLRGIEEEGIRRRAAEIRVAVPTAVALYLLNQKRQALSEIEQRYGLRVFVDGDETLIPPHYKLERVRARPVDQQAPVPLSMTSASYDDDDAIDAVEETDDEIAAEGAGAEIRREESGDEDGQEGRGRRRRRRRRGRRPDDAGMNGEEAPGLGEQPTVHGHDMVPEGATPEAEAEADEALGQDGDIAAAGERGLGEPNDENDPNRRRRRRGRRGGRRRRHGEPREMRGDDGGGEQRDFHGRDVAPHYDQHIGHQNTPDVMPSREAEHDQAFNERPVPASDAMPSAPSYGAADRAGQPSDSAPSPHVETPPQVERREERHSSAPQAPAAEENVPAGPPRKGWWQRLTTRD